MSTSTPRPDKRIYVPVTTIIEGDRIREDYGDLKELATNIQELGLIHPPTIDLSGRLVAGGRRLRAMRDVLGWTEIPVTYIELLDPTELDILEAEENVRRQAFTWRETVKSIAKVHRNKSVKAALKSDRWTKSMTGECLNMSQASISYALMLVERLEANDVEITQASTISDALKILVVRKENEVNAAIAKNSLPKGNTSPSSGLDLLSMDFSGGLPKPSTDNFYAQSAGIGIGARDQALEMPGSAKPAPEIVIPISQMLIQGDCIHVMANTPDGTYDHVITDIPYGIDMGMLQQTNSGMDVTSVVAEHGVDDNLDLMQRLFPRVFSVMKDSGYFILWCDITYWERLTSYAETAGFKVQRWPLVWLKTHTCLNQAAQYNFTKNYELAMVCRKGNATLLTAQGSSVWTGTNSAERELLGHPFVKPYKLWQFIFSAVAQRGTSVLDPFAGRGSSTIAAIQSGLRPTAIELNTDHHSGLITNVTNFYNQLYPNVKFT